MPVGHSLGDGLWYNSPPVAPKTEKPVELTDAQYDRVAALCQPEFGQMAEVNRAYQREFITNEVRAELLNVLQDSDGNERDEKGTKHEVAMLRVAYGAMLRQIYGDKSPPEKPANNQWKTPHFPITKEGWRAVKPSRTKRMQAKYTPLAFRRENPSIDEMIVDLREISPTLLKNLGFGEFVKLKKDLPDVQEGDPAGNDLDARKLAAREGAIPGLKDIFKTLTPLPSMWGMSGLSNNYRMYLIGEGAAKGKLLVTRSENGKYFMGVYDVLGGVRRVDHSRQQYNTEAIHLRQIHTLLDGVLTMLNVPQSEILEEKEFDLRTKQIATAKDDLANTVKKLKKVRDEDKEKLRDVIKAISNFQDSLGRENFGSSAAQLAPIVTRGKFIGSRIAGMKGKASALEGDQRVLFDAAIAHQKPFEAAYAKVKETDIPAEDKLTARKRGEIMTYANEVEHSLEGLKLEPFASFAERMKYHLNELRLCIKQPSREHTGEGIKPTTTEELLRVFLIGKLTLFHREIMKLYASISLHQGTPRKQDWIRATEIILTSIDKRPVGKKTYAAEFNLLWIAIKTFICENLQPKIDALHDEISLEEKEKDREIVKDAINDFLNETLIPFIKDRQPRFRTQQEVDAAIKASASADQPPTTPDETPTSS